MDAETNIAAFRMMFEAIGFTISADIVISDQRGINKFSELKALSDDGKRMRQDEHLIIVVHKPSGWQDGHVINAHSQKLFNLAGY